MNKFLILALSCVLITSCSSDKEKHCQLTGKVIDRESKTLIVKKQTESYNLSKIEIKIDSAGNSKYDLNFEYIEAYELIFKDELDRGLWKPTLFFPDNDKIEFTLYPMEKADSNKVVGGKLSLENSAFHQLVKDIFYSKYYSWNQILDSLKNINETDTDYANAISDSLKNLLQATHQFELKYIKNNPSIYTYSRFLSILRSEKDRRHYVFDTLKKCASLLQQKFPNHPYNEIAQLRLNGLNNINVGGSYVDFTAKDSIGNEHTISDIIVQNKLTLIDLWAPWCGPCIRKSKKVLPIYEEYKEKGFGVVGVVGGIRTKEKFKQAITNHSYPWLLLSEINNEKHIWEKYYISKDGGSQFLVDNKGKIIAINPSTEELKKYILAE